MRDPYLTVGAAVDLHLTIRRLLLLRMEIRLIAVLVQIAQIGAGIVGMNVFSGAISASAWPIGKPYFTTFSPFIMGIRGKLMSTTNGPRRNVTD